MSDAPSYMTPTRRERLKAASLYLLLWLWFISHAYWPDWFLAAAPPERPCDSFARVQALAVYFNLIPVVVGAFFIWHASRVFRSGQWPVPGSWRVLRTRVHTGLLAKLDGFAFLGVALLCFYFAIVVAHELKLVHVLCLVPPCSCAPG